jgi:hypothetical protein
MDGNFRHRGDKREVIGFSGATSFEFSILKVNAKLRGRVSNSKDSGQIDWIPYLLRLEGGNGLQS